MARTVKVGLDVDEAPYVRGVERAEKATAKLDDAVESAGGSAKETAAGMGKASESISGVGRSARGAGKELTGLKRDAAILDKQMADTSRTIRDLAREIVRTADTAERAKLTEKLKVERGQLRGLTGLRKLIDTEAEDAATGFSTAFAARLGPLIARAPISLGPVGAAIAAPIAAEVVTVLGAAVAAGITGGAGVGGVIGGVTIASKHAAVKSAAESLGKEFENRLQSAAVSFVPATLDGISVIRNNLAAVEGDLESIFSNSARFVVPLAEGAGTGLQEIVSGARALVEVADPAIDAISEGLAELGSAARDGLESLTDNAESGARALTLVFEVVETGIRMVFGLINVLAELYEVMEFGNGLFEWFSRANDDGGKKSEEFAAELATLMDGFRDTSTEAEDAARAVQQYADALDEIVDQNLSAAETNLRYRESLKEAKDAIDKKRKVTSGELEQLLALAKTANAATDAMEEQGASTERLSAHQRDAREEFIRIADRMGYTKDQAKQLADQYLKIPRKVPTEVTVDTAQAARNLRDIIALSAQIRSKRVVITTVNNEVRVRSEGRNVPIGTGVGGRRWGGIDYAMARGGMIEAHFATSPTVMYGERETRGEAYIPRDGDDARSRVIAQTVVEDWLGGQVVWPGRAGTSPTAMSAVGGDTYVIVEIDGQQLEGRIKRVVRDSDRDLKRRVMAGSGTRR
ncbi:hypothetical protein ABGB07_36100 [Micromonosporaceae bacterium B7E4]